MPRSRTFRKIYQHAAPGVIAARGLKRYKRKMRGEEEEGERAEAALQKITEPTTRQAGQGQVSFVTERYV